MQRNRLSFKGQKIYIGIDVHKTTWQICVLTETGFSEKHAQKASAQELFDFLKKHYPDGEYHAVYESGFSGFSTYYALTELGIHCSIVHAADVPTTQYETLMKTDKVDAVKLARALRNGTIHSVYMREKENLDDLAVMRVRKAIMKDLSSFKTRVKHIDNIAISVPLYRTCGTVHLTRAVPLISLPWYCINSVSLCRGYARMVPPA
jgi:hypothetical protein